MIFSKRKGALTGSFLTNSIYSAAAQRAWATFVVNDIGTNYIKSIPKDFEYG